MNGPQEHPDVPMQPPTPPAAPPPAPPTQAAQPAASDAVPAAGAGRARGLQHKVPFIACALSLMPGVGQIYVGYYKLSFIHNIVDAGQRAIYYNLALDGVEGIEMPSMNLSAPSFGGLFAGGLVLVGVGVVLLSNTLWSVSLDWIEEAWPLAPILLGAYLVVKAIQERKSGTPSADTAGDPPTYGSDTNSSPLV